jgi:hypothetical protein
MRSCSDVEHAGIAQIEDVCPIVFATLNQHFDLVFSRCEFSAKAHPNPTRLPTKVTL